MKRLIGNIQRYSRFSTSIKNMVEQGEIQKAQTAKEEEVTLFDKIVAK